MTTAIQLRDYARDLDVTTLGTHLVRSGFFADSKDVSQAVVKVLAGRELGIGPVASMTGIFIVKGRITLSANLVGSLIQGSGRYVYRVTNLDAFQCTIRFFEGNKGAAQEEIGVSTFTMDDAKQADLLTNPTYKKFPKNMLFSRALTNGARWFCPDVFNGPVYTPDELDQSTVLDADNNVVSVPMLEAAQPADVVPQKVWERYVSLFNQATELGMDVSDYDIDRASPKATVAEKGKALAAAINDWQTPGSTAPELPPVASDTIDEKDLAMIQAGRV